MKHAFGMFSVLSLVALGCGAESPGDDGPPGEGVIRTASEVEASQRVLALTAEQNGQSFDVRPGVFVTVTLEENPTTGYHWRDRSPYNEPSHDRARPPTALPVVSVFNLLSSTFTRGLSDALGSGGIRVFAYQQSSIGFGTIRLELIAPGGTVVEKLEFKFNAFNPSDTGRAR
jgi:hypothetical protein